MEKQFRTKLSYDIFKNKYAHTGCETWDALAKTLTNDVVGRFTDTIGKDTVDSIYEMIRDMKFLPGGRYLYYAGRKQKFFNNCFSKNTKIMTSRGLISMEEMYNLQEVGNKVRVLSPVDGKYKDAKMNKHGVQELYLLTFAPVRGRSKITYQVEATKDHRWPLIDGSETTDIRVGDIVPANLYSAGSNPLGFLHGFIYGDGNRNGQLRLCSDKDQKYLDMFINMNQVSVTYPPSADGDPVIYASHNIAWKSLPKDQSPDYIASFIEGWIAADGSDDRMLCSVNKEALGWFRENAIYAGLVISGELREQIRDVTIGDYYYQTHSMFIQNFSRGDKWQGFKLIKKEYLDDDVVYCPFEPKFNRIVIEHNIDTYNCYLLRSEEDSREDWANLSWKAESCLLTGGGIGNDYSMYRPSGSIISRTGGNASGPIPKMLMVNEIGRRVMQGGSRRSAIYASLNWEHGDIQEFLKVKNWHESLIPGTDKTLADVKQVDWNFPAPLDMTNISVNYDTKWVTNFFRTGDIGEVFLENVKQALSTGEPGFSFNFFDKEYETLRNACTEVTSSDDSDVCNLGSINLSRIHSIDEFVDIVELATIFLLCGTFVAHLPYDKVREVREKNRRLGLGLMGIHEWLIQRGYRYEVTPELHQWLQVYKGVSDSVATYYSNKFSCSRPVAVRSVAPTGTIGMVAGTTTGIEPVYAVAYKRRYLKKNKWHYQYAVDSAAQTVIEQTGCDPEKVESAIDLATDYERRIKFQADIQDYVDMAISSTINLPARDNQEIDPKRFAKVLASYAPRLRGFTCYPDGSRGGQPLTSVSYHEAIEKLGEEYEENLVWNDVCDITGGGYCGT